MLKRAGRAPFVQRMIGNALACYLQMVRSTSTFVLDPPDFFDAIRPDLPVICAMWHGQHFLLPFARPPGHEARAMISKSADGEINAIAAERLGMGAIRASGAHKPHQVAKRGGARGFIEALRALRDGASVSITADVPKISRVAGPGIVQLAARSGRPILPLAAATRWHVTLGSWDRATINLPFSTMSIATGPLIHVPQDADEAQIEAARLEVEAAMNAVTERAYELVGRRP
jgi:lysophospholipid acyltransferase (LPLAT)-like uncharacterized protein